MSEVCQKASTCQCDNPHARFQNKLKFEAQTTNQSYFKQHPIDRKPPIQPPKIHEKHYDPQSLKTSYSTQYQKPKKPDTSGSIFPPSTDLVQSYNRSKKINAPFYSETEYKKSFQTKEIKREKQPSHEYRPNKNKFEGKSAYKEQFIEKKNADLLAAGNEITKYVENYSKKNKIKFQGSSSYKDTFQKPQLKIERQPNHKYQPKNIKFQGESSYKANFIPLPKDAYKSELDYCPVHPEKITTKK